MGTRSSLYRIARAMGDINAVQKGHIGKRIIRKTTYRSVNKTLGRFLR